MRLALHPAICGWDIELMADYCRYMGVTDLFYQLHDVEGYKEGGFEDAGALGRLAGAGLETLILFVLQPQSDELWKAVSALYKSLVPRAEAAGVKIASHGHWCEGHLAYNRGTLQRIIDLAPEPANAICLCAGCFYQAGDDPTAIVRAMPDRIHCVHIRDTSLRGGCDLEELPLGAGAVPIANTIRALKDTGYNGLVIPEHLSTLRAQANMETTHAHALGCIRGILDANESGAKSK